MFPILLPPLRERREDLPLLIHHLLKQEGFAEVDVHPEVMAVLQQYSWPGNVRELRNVLVRASTLSTNRLITRDDLPSELQTLQPSSSLQSPSSHHVDPEQIRQALRECNGNVSRAAKLLGLHRSTLRHRLREYGLTDRFSRK